MVPQTPEAEAERTLAQPKRVVVAVGDGQAGLRADRALVQLLAAAGRTASRADVQRWMRQGLVHSDGRAVRQTDRLSRGAKVEIVIGSALLSAAEPDPTVQFEVVYEDEALLVIDKPPGLVVHPARGHRSGTLVNGLLARGSFDASLADPRDPEGHLRPGIVQRLDKDTSGLLVVAKLAAAREGLKAQLQRHDMERHYLAIAVGTARAAEYDTPHGRHATRRRRFTTRLPRGGHPRRAITRVEPLRQLAGATLVRCTLRTGRTHQIRVHLAERGGTPVLADALYGGPPPTPLLARVAAELGRQALHAAVLGFSHPRSGEALRFVSPLPADMQRAVTALTRPST